MTRSLMPKGVEHMVSPCAAYCKSVVTRSLMPKGVEHATRRPPPSGIIFVTRSLMPKGVEHFDDLQARLPLYGDSFVDAERR